MNTHHIICHKILLTNNITAFIIICGIFTTTATSKSFLRNNEIFETSIVLHLKQIDNFTVKLYTYHNR